MKKPTSGTAIHADARSAPGSVFLRILTAVLILAAVVLPAGCSFFSCDAPEPSPEEVETASGEATAVSAPDMKDTRLG